MENQSLEFSLPEIGSIPGKDNVTHSKTPEDRFWLRAKGMSQVTDTLIIKD